MTDIHIWCLQKSTQVLRNPSLLLRQQASGASDSREEAPPDAAGELLQRLQRDITEAAELDTLYSPQSDIIRHVLGTVLGCFVHYCIEHAALVFTLGSVLFIISLFDCDFDLDLSLHQCSCGPPQSAHGPHSKRCEQILWRRGMR